MFGRCFHRVAANTGKPSAQGGRCLEKICRRIRDDQTDLFPGLGYVTNPPFGEDAIDLFFNGTVKIGHFESEFAVDGIKRDTLFGHLGATVAAEVDDPAVCPLGNAAERACDIGCAKDMGGREIRNCVQRLVEV